jgi:hypothetical protein
MLKVNSRSNYMSKQLQWASRWVVVIANQQMNVCSCRNSRCNLEPAGATSELTNANVLPVATLNHQCCCELASAKVHYQMQLRSEQTNATKELANVNVRSKLCAVVHVAADVLTVQLWTVIPNWGPTATDAIVSHQIKIMNLHILLWVIRCNCGLADAVGN